MHVWQTFFSLAHVWQTSVFLNRIPLPGHHRKTVNGRVQIWATLMEPPIHRSVEAVSRWSGLGE